MRSYTNGCGCVCVWENTINQKITFHLTLFLAFLSRFRCVDCWEDVWSQVGCSVISLNAFLVGFVLRSVSSSDELSEFEDSCLRFFDFVFFTSGVDSRLLFLICFEGFSIFFVLLS